MSTFAEALTTALFHSLWQDAIVGLALGVALASLRQRTPNARYLAGCVALGVMAMLPIATMAILLVRALPSGLADTLVGASLHVAGGRSPAIAATVRTGPTGEAATWIGQLQQLALPAWTMGVLLFSLRPVFGAAHALTLKRRSEPADDTTLALVARLGQRLAVRRPVRVVMSALTSGPATLGWLRPVILLPPATLLGLTPQQLEAVLAHELAHIRRHDYLVNVVQMVVETLFFYHPAVWWASKRIRLERELCCDDVAVACCGDAIEYAHALARVAQVRLPRASIAVGSSGGPLLCRIQRLLGMPATPGFSSRAWTLPGVAIVLASLAFTGAQALAGGAQTRPAQGATSIQGQRDAAGTGSVSGRVLDAQSGKPVTNATVTVNLAPTAQTRGVHRAATRVDGRYEIGNLAPADRYYVSVGAPGYVGTFLGQTAVDPIGTGMASGGAMLEVPVRVRAGETTPIVDVRLDRTSAVSGRILGDAGEALPGIEVELLRKTYQPGGAVPIPVSFRQSERFGVFRMARVPAGEYYVRAYAPDSTTRPAQERTSAAPSAYAPTFFPGTTNIRAARTIVVRPGQEITRIDFALAATKTYVVSGKLVDPSGAPPAGASVVLVSNSPGTEPEPRPQSNVAADGRFEVRGVIPGFYTLVIQDDADVDRWLSVRRALSVDSDLTGLELAPQRGTRIEGRLVRDQGGRLPFDPSRILVTLDHVSAGSGQIPPAMPGGPGLQRDGTFWIESPAGNALLQVSRLPSHWMVKAVRLDGADVTDLDLPLTPGARQQLEIVLTDRVSGLAGSVTDQAGRVAPYSLVVVFPRDQSQWNFSRMIRTAFSNDDGTYEVGDLAPAEYRAVAVASLPADAWTDPAVLDRLSPLATPIRIAEGRRPTLALRLAPVPADLE